MTKQVFNFLLFIMLSLGIAAPLQAASAAADTLVPELEVFRPFLNKVWRGELKTPAGREKPVLIIRCGSVL